MSNLEDYIKQFPCYHHEDLKYQMFNGFTPVSTTLPYSIEMVMIKKVKKMLDNNGGDLFVVSFNLDNKPLVLDGGISTFSIKGIEKECKVITQLPIQYKGYRCWSIVCQFTQKEGTTDVLDYSNY
ncbi:hypothetical protein H0I54_11650 [Yersinia kristensenii]|uniref:hypothetical protein n=1 Tax=Yersinia kristensenii TaxID=28152 RepID=UPI001C60967E|nr:hypothetical protein [Yersinia kristensenii]MBW5842467.1 hypothetical protein [Yersinia kristensenii]